MHEAYSLLPVRSNNKIVGKVFIDNERLFVLPGKKKYDSKLLTHAVKKANKLFGVPTRDFTKKRRKHSTVGRKIGEEVVRVDKSIVDLVDYLNSLKGVQTHFSCEGHKNDWDSSYVSFECGDIKKLFRLIERSQRFAHLDLSYYGDLGLRYGLYIRRKFDITELVKVLKMQ